MTSILSRLLTSDKPWTCPYNTQQATRSGPVVTGYPCSGATVMSPGSNVSNALGVENKKTKTSAKYPPDTSVRFGRVPKREKAKILAAMQKVNASSQEKALGIELEDELKLMSTIVRAHEETCDYTKDKVQILIEKAREHPVYAQCPPQLSCPLNSAPHITDDGASHYMEDFSERFTPAIQGVVEYAKRIPGFSFLSQDDQLTLLKAGVFEVLLVRLACMFDSQASTLISLNGQVLRRESLHSASNARFLLDSMFDFAERLNGLHLTDSEVGLFGAVVVIAADRPGLRNTDLVLKIQKKLMDILQKTVMANHTENPNIFGDLMKKIPDLRTLNTLHSEKLLAYKMEPRNQTANGQTVDVPNGVSNSCPVVFNPNIYASIPHEIWSQYSMVATQQCLTIDEGQRSTSPGQHSQHSGTSTASEWSTTDSKDEHDLMGSPRSVGSGLCVEDAKSPLRTSSFSSSRSYTGEDIWPAEIGPQTADYHSNKRIRESNGSEHGSSSGDEGYFVDSPVKGTVVYPKLRRVDSPTDSGIESGKEHSGPSTTPTISVCSSPRSAVDEKVKDVVEDMPVLKRALQAPPLVNTNMLMDEAYRHHKKFRAARRDADSPSSPSSISLASTHSTLVRTLEQAPRYLSEQQLKRTDLIHNIIMRTETLPGQQPQVTSQPLPPHQNQQTSHSLPHELSQQQQHQQLQQSNNGTTIGIQLTVNGQYPFNTSVPNHSPVPPSFISSPQQQPQQQQQQQQKNLLLCPSGYYIPHRNSSSPIYTASATSWQFGQSPHTTSTMSATSVSPTPIQIHTQFAPSASEHEQTHPSQSQNTPNAGNLCPVNLHSPDHQQRSSAGVVQSLSPRLVYSSRASPVAPGSPLVISGLSPAAAASSPVPPVCQLESSRISSPVQQRQNESADSQPLNLSKKLFSPPMLKMES